MSRLDEIERRLAAATPGPWAWRNTAEPYLMGVRTRIVMAFRRMGTQGAQPQFRDDHGLLVDAGKANLNAFPDAVLIANAPADLAALVQFARAVEAARRRSVESGGTAMHLRRLLDDATAELNGGAS